MMIVLCAVAVATLCVIVQSQSTADKITPVSWKGALLPSVGDETYLLAATDSNDASLVESLLKSGVDPNVKSEHESATTPLQRASDKGYARVVDLLLQHEARVSTRGHRGFTPLHGAAFHGHVEVVELLLAAGAGDSAHLKDKSGKTALAIALKKNHSTICDLIAPHSTTDWVDLLETQEALSCIVTMAAILATLVHWVNSTQVRRRSGGLRARSLSIELNKNRRKNGKQF